MGRTTYLPDQLFNSILENKKSPQHSSERGQPIFPEPPPRQMNLLVADIGRWTQGLLERRSGAAHRRAEAKYYRIPIMDDGFDADFPSQATEVG